MSIEAVIFDIGNVLLKFDYYIAANRLVAKNQLAALPERELVVSAKRRLERGEIDRAEFLRQVRPHFSDFGTDAEFLRIWEDIFEENIPMTDLATRLALSMPTYLLSNISCIHREYIFITYPVFQIFRDGVFSYEAGALKPQLEIYQTAIRQFGIRPETTVFIDDIPENISAAAALGFQAIPYDFGDHTAAETTLRALGVEWQ